MNKNFITLFAALNVVAAASAVDVKGLQAGKLSDMGIEPTETSLTITGEMDATDFHYILDNLPNLQTLNISGVNIVAYNGASLPYTGLKASPANTLPDYALTGMSELTSITLPKSLTAIGKGSLSGCGITSLDIPDKVESVGDYAAMRCESLTNLKVNGVSSFGTRAFANCPKLATVEIASSATELPEGLFEACIAIKKVDLSALANCTDIGAWSFAECNGIETLVLPPATVELATGSLYGASTITSLALPADVDYIDNQAMASMTGLETLRVNDVAQVPQLGSNVWANVDQSKVTLVTPDDMVDEYSQADQWKNFNILAEKDWHSSTVDITSATSADKAMEVKVSDSQILITSASQPLGTVAVFNSAGMRMVAVESDRNVRINVSGWPNGVYLVVSNLGAEKVAF